MSIFVPLSFGRGIALEGRALKSLGFQPQAGEASAFRQTRGPCLRLGLKPQALQTSPLQGSRIVAGARMGASAP